MPCPLCRSDKTVLFSERNDLGAAPCHYYRCPDCFLIFLSPEERLGPGEEKKRYDTHRNDPADQRYLNHLAKLGEPLSRQLAPGASGLDFGCGPGPAMSVWFFKRGYAMEDYDPIYRPETSLLHKTYDFVTCTEVAEHLYDPHQEFQLLDRLLKPGGVLGIMTGILEDEAAFQTWWYPRDRTHVCFYQRRTLEWMARRFHWNLELPAPNIVIFRKEKLPR